MSPLTISKICHGKVGFSVGVLLRIHEIFDLPFAELRTLLAEG